MTAAATNWDELNAQHLAAGVKWVLLRLERLAAATIGPTSPIRGGFWSRLFGASAATPGRPTRFDPTIPSAGERQLLDQLGDIERQSGESRPPAMTFLEKRLELGSFERNVLLLCVAAELNTGTGPLCARACLDPSRPYPTFSLALRLFADPDWGGLTPDRPLRRWHLIELQQPAGTPLVQAALRIDERVLHFLKGWQRMDERLAPMICIVDAQQQQIGPLCESQAMVAAQIEAEWQTAAASQARSPLIQLLGPDPDSKLLVALVAASRVRYHLCRLPLEQLPASLGDLDLLASLWQRESRLYGLMLYLDADDEGGFGSDALGASRALAINRLLGQLDGGVFLGSRDQGPRLTHTRAVLNVEKPTEWEQRQLWCDVLGDGHRPLANRLAAQFRLNQQTIRAIARRLALLQPTAPDEWLYAAWKECRQFTRPRLDGLAQRIDSKATWGDLVLARSQLDQLRELSAQVRNRWQVYDEWGFALKLNRGLGISALFSGESGTGKTMAAEVIANELDLDLYRVDLSAVVSKYIGETEKNLRRVFDAFEDCGAVLFFDECDALFGKRTEVKDSHDRYANIEVSYLLQRLESYRGLAILATNNKGGLDSAFLRRLRLIVPFGMPDSTMRESIWKKLLPEPGHGSLPTENLDYSWLAKFELSGGSIQTAALNAAFLAAQRGHVAVMLQDAGDAIKAELSKLNKPVRAEDMVLPSAIGSADRVTETRPENVLASTY